MSVYQQYCIHENDDKAHILNKVGLMKVCLL